MYAFIRGELVSKNASSIIVEAKGVGYRLLIPSRYYAQLPELGEVILVYTSFVVRENAQILFGFASQEECTLFEKLITLSGIGPKTGLSVLSHLTLEEFHEVVALGEVKTLSKVPGIGKKTAERLLIDLKGKSFQLAEGVVKTGVRADAVQALENLGYSSQSANLAVKNVLEKLGEKADLSQVIATALREA